MPDDPDLQCGLARAYAPSAPALMIEALEAALARNSNHVGSLLLLVDRQIDAEEYGEATRLLDRIATVNPWDPEAWAYRAVLAHLENKAEQEARQERPDVFLIYVPNKDGETFTRVTLTRRNTGFVGPQGEFYPLMPTVAHLAAMYGTAKEAVKTDDAVVRIQVPRKNGQGLTEVQLKKTEQGYVGPQGELYPQMPSVDQLAEVYGGN